MGGIKNRDEKRKAAKVFSSGGGGGSKGPSVIDKRNQELKCPHCDRIFKQSGRLNDHVKKQHSDLQEVNDEEKVKKHESETNLTSIINDSEKGENEWGNYRIMCLNSKSGQYDYKSPKLLLHEMRLRDKLPKARYKSIFDQESSLWRCKVVLPHPKKSDEDIVVFLSTKHASKTESEAQQRAAVLALHKIAGNRAFERTLPPMYVELWKELVEKQKIHLERAAREDERRRTERDKKAREMRRQGPVPVIMTDGHRKMVEEVIQNIRDVSLDKPQAQSNVRSELVEELVALGFSSRDSASAASECNSLPSALDWLCLNLPEEQLPSSFAAGAAGKPVSILHVKPRQGFNVDEEVEDPAVREIMLFGYSKNESISALERSRGDIDRGLYEAFKSAVESWQIDLQLLSYDYYTPHDEPVVENDSLEEEMMALESIFGPEMKIISKQKIEIKVRSHLSATACESLSSKLQRSFPEECVELTVGFTFPRPTEDNAMYPKLPPLVYVKSKELPGYLMKPFTKASAQIIADLVGNLVTYEVITMLTDNLSDLILAHDSENSMSEAKISNLKDTGHVEERMQSNGLQDKTPIFPLREPLSRPFSEAEIEKESKRLAVWHDQLQKNMLHSAMASKRAALPAARKKQDVLSAVRSSAVTVIMGSTGCGKSTQVPQFILEDAIENGRGGFCNIICTQPRRISAVGLASRVACERSENVGKTVGYSVRLDSKQSRQTRLLFCTTGIMLRRLLGEPDLKSVTHVVLDEVHERTMESDLLLFLLRNLLESGQNPELKIVLMSATADANLFASYFKDKKGCGNCPVVSIPGFTYPVKDFFLEDVLEWTQFSIGKSSKWARKAVGRHEEKTLNSMHLDKYSDSTRKSLLYADESVINVDLVEALVDRVIQEDKMSKSRTPNLGSILIFVPGADTISKVVRTLQNSSKIAERGNKVLVLPLHGGLPPSEQNKVFDRPPVSVTKVVVSTNVAETSITIDDITCVIDTGRAKEVRFDASKGISRLQEVFISQASCMQRRGRAGRVQEGKCYRLFSAQTWNSLDKNTLPEISRSPLHSLVLNTKAVYHGNVFETLQRMLTPPPSDGLEQAVISLQRMGALDHGSQDLTPLGEHLTKMPCDPKLGKMLIFGSMLRCMDPVLTIVAAQGFGRPVFWSPPDNREAAETAKSGFMKPYKSTKSDHIAIIAAYNGWRSTNHLSGKKAASRYCSQWFISEQAMESIHAGRRQYADILCSLGFLPQRYGDMACKMAYVPPGVDDSQRKERGAFAGVGEPDEFSGDARVVKAALASGFYPQLLRVENPAAQYQKVQGGAIETEGSSGKRVKLFDREKGRVFIHPASVNFDVGKFESGWLVYSDIVQTSKVFVRESSMIPVYAVLLFGGLVTVHHEDGIIKVDNWAAFKAPARIGVLVRELRHEVSQLLWKKIQDPSTDLAQSKLIDAMHQLLSSDGF